ncbi:MAG: hypothetical protein JNK49_19740 [Planctomycetes bacterium]|nr:hypothetical protein [Planctomycetota bacterium]
MNKLDRSPLAVLDGLSRLAELIECDLNRIEGLSKPLAIALTEVRWLNLKAVWFPGQKLIQERLRYLGNNLRSLVGQVGEKNRVEALRRCHAEIEKLREPECFGRFVSAEFKNSI